MSSEGSEHGYADAQRVHGEAYGQRLGLTQGLVDALAAKISDALPNPDNAYVSELLPDYSGAKLATELMVHPSLKWYAHWDLALALGAVPSFLYSAMQDDFPAALVFLGVGGVAVLNRGLQRFATARSQRTAYRLARLIVQDLVGSVDAVSEMSGEVQVRQVRGITHVHALLPEQALSLIEGLSAAMRNELVAQARVDAARKRLEQAASGPFEQLKYRVEDGPGAADEVGGAVNGQAPEEGYLVVPADGGGAQSHEG